MVTRPLSGTDTEESVTIIAAKPDELPAIHHLLSTVNLPIEGVEEALNYFWVAREEERIIGSVGLEVYADLALLRSLAVAPQRQGSGVGHALVETVLAYMTSRQYRGAFLLTTTAESFFTRYGFAPISRTEVPASVQQSVEFQSVCPDTATCMARLFTYPPLAPPSEISIRMACFADLPVIQEIRNQGIVDRVATLDTEPHTIGETRAWFHQHGPRQPVWVAQAPAGLAGWASLNTFNPRKAYQYVADLSVYIARPWRGKGVGTRLLQTLLPTAPQLGYHKIVLSAFPFNTAGIRLYERHGFTTVGIYKEMGLVDGQWVDTIIMERLFDATS